MQLQKLLAVSVLIIFYSSYNPSSAQAPEPPLPIELMPGNNSLYFQMVVKKKFAPESRFGFFSVATYTVPWDDFSRVDITLPVLFTYNLGKGFALTAGGRINNVIGFNPLAGLQHTYASKQILTVTVASLFLNEYSDGEIFGLYEYKPPLNEKWSIYSRLQFLYVHGLEDNQHGRSYLYLRAGVKRNALAFGVGTNLDRYGPDKIFKENYGVFVKWDLK